MKKKLIIMSMVMAGLMFGQILYEEHFTGGAMQLTWHAWFRDSAGIGDSMQVISDASTPGGDSWAGKISNEWMGAAGLTYAGLDTLKDYSVEAWIYTRVTSANGPYNGISIRMNLSTGYFYRMVSDFDNSARLRLGFVGSGGMPVVIRDWSSGEIPGGVPTSSSWHKFKLTTVGDQIWAYYDNALLPSCPITYDSIANGCFGVYTFNMADTSATKCDDIVVRLQAWGVEERGDAAASRLAVYPNPFKSGLNIRCTMHDAGYMIKNPSLAVYDISGKRVKDLTNDLVSCIMNHGSAVSWDGTDDRGKRLAPGIYFVTDRQSGAMVKAVKID